MFAKVLVTKQTLNQTQVLEMTLLELFCDVDDFCLSFEPQYNHFLLSEGIRKRRRKRKMSMSEMMTILIFFHQERYRDFKTFYLNHVQVHLRSDFPQTFSYSRFVELIPSVLQPMIAYSHSKKGRCTGLSFIDATSLKVCHNRRIPSHKTFDGLAKRGKTSMGWFFGFKLHLVINEKGELLSYYFTPGNHDDRSVFPKVLSQVFGQLYGDRGYISKKWVEELKKQGIHLVYPARKNMKPKMISLFDRLMLRKRALIESVIDQLKNISQVEHSRHRGVGQFMTHSIAALIAYSLQPSKPSLKLERSEYSLLPAIV